MTRGDHNLVRLVAVVQASEAQRADALRDAALARADRDEALRRMAATGLSVREVARLARLPVRVVRAAVGQADAALSASGWEQLVLGVGRSR